MRGAAPGEVLHARYELRQRIGDGGTAEVWQAHDRRLDRPVAIKFIPGASEDRIRREAQAAARLVDPHIAGIYDFGDGYLVMELLSGETLADRLRAGPLPWPEAARIAAGVASALATAHRHGIVHRDIKPANIMLTPAGVKVLDFGIAAAAYRDRDGATIAGTPGYAAPERLRDAPADPASDVYSLAVVLSEMTTGKLPRPISTWSDLARTDFTRPVDPPAAPDPDVRAWLAAALDADAARRPTAAALAGAFGTSGAPWRATVPTPGAAAGPPPTLVTARRTSGVAAVPAGRPAPTTVADPAVLGTGRPPAIRIGIIAAAVVVLLLAGLVVYSVAHRTPAAGPTTSSSAPVAPTSAAPASASPSSDVATMLTELSQRIDAAGFDHDVAKDLSRRVQSIRHAWDKGDRDKFREGLQQLRDDIRHPSGDHGDGGGGQGNGGDQGNGGPDPAVVQGIDDLITRLLAAAGR